MRRRIKYAVLRIVLLFLPITNPSFADISVRSNTDQANFQSNITLGISIFASALSVTTLLFSMWQWRRKNVDDARKSLTESIAGMITTKQKLEEFRLDTKERYGNIENLSYRIALSDQRQLYLANAMKIIDNRESDISPTYFDYLMLASNLIDIGRVRDSIKYYEKSVELARLTSNEVACAAGRRVYGRAQIAAGDYDEGRQEMLAAAKDYLSLAENSSFNQDQMVTEAAETYRRLILVQMQKGYTKKIEDDLIKMQEILHKVKDNSNRDTLLSGFNQIQKTMFKAEKDISEQ
jgi:hypothetical protein